MRQKYLQIMRSLSACAYVSKIDIRSNGFNSKSLFLIQLVWEQIALSNTN